MTDPEAAFAELAVNPTTSVGPLLDAVLADPARAADGRPRTIGVMVSSVDGHATVKGRSGGLGSPEDRLVFRGMRERVDALLVGPGTLNRERYSTVLDAHQREARRASGLPEEPPLATITRGFSLDPDLPLLHQDVVDTLIYTEVDPPAGVDGPRVEIVRLGRATPSAALGDLHRRGVRTLACEGGPSLLAALVADGLLDELLLTVSPQLVGGPDPLTILAGLPSVDPSADPVTAADPGVAATEPRALRLRGTWRGGDVLFLHYHLTDRRSP
ncbi:MAG: dihydrofolate reductase family protein [Solirubrobacteraceae bacterium]